MRIRKIPHARSFLSEAENVIIADDIISQIDMHTLPLQEKGVFLEIGCGKGDFIIALAQANPERFYYALEKDASVLMKAVKKAMPFQLANVRFILGDAVQLGELFPPASIRKIYLNFSDPWPKTRHAKRRLTYHRKLELYEKLLVSHGKLELKTDSQILFESSLLELSQAAWCLDRISLDLHRSAAFSNTKTYQSAYEQKFMHMGKRIYYLCASKKNRQNNRIDANFF